MELWNYLKRKGLTGAKYESLSAVECERGGEMVYEFPNCLLQDRGQKIQPIRLEWSEEIIHKTRDVFCCDT